MLSSMPVLVNIDVEDVERAAHFYVEALGLRVGRRLGKGFLELLGAEVPIYLLENARGSLPFADASTGRTYERHWSPIHLDFVVPDISAAVERAVRAGAWVEKPVQEEPYGLLAVLSDPFGHGFCFLQFQGQGYDEIAS